MYSLCSTFTHGNQLMIDALRNVSLVEGQPRVAIRSLNVAGLIVWITQLIADTTKGYFDLFGWNSDKLRATVQDEFDRIDAPQNLRFSL